MSDKTTNGQNAGNGLVRTNVDVPATVSFARNPLAKDALYRDLIEVLWRRKWVILGIVLVCLAYAYYAVQKMTPIYASTLRVYVQQNGQKPLPGVDGLQTDSSANSFMNVQVDRIKSTRIAAATLELLRHAKPSEAPPPVWASGGWKALDMDPKVVTAFYNRKLKTFEGSGNPVGQLKGMLTVDIGKNDDSLEITVESPYSDEAALIANKLVEAYKADDVVSRRTTASDLLIQLRGQEQDRDKELSDLRDKKEKAEDAIGVGVAWTDKGNALNDRLQMLSAAWTTAEQKAIAVLGLWQDAQTKRNDADALEKMVMAESSGGGTTIQPLSELTQARQRVADIDMQLSTAIHMGQLHPYVQNLQAQRNQATELVKTLERKTADMYLDIINQQLLRAEKARDEAKKQYEAQAVLVATANRKAVESVTLENEISRVEKLKDTIDERIREIDLTSDVRAPTISVLEDAQPAGAPSKPQKTKLMAIALAVGLFLGLGSAFLLDWMDHRIRSPEDIRSIVQLPILGLVPHVSRRTAFAQLGQAVHLQPRSAVAESFRTVRMAVHFSGIERSCQKILVTSAVLGDGKTVTASNLAIAVAQAGQRAVIIDADFHRPRQHLIFGTPNEAGLSNVLQGQCPLEDVVLTTPIPRVDILPCGPLPANPYELLNSKAFNEVFEVLKLHYDHIIIDSPPVLAVADALVLAAMSDATVLVARVHRSRRQAFEEAVASLGQVGTRILGVVVNDVRGGKERYSLYRTHYSAKGTRLDGFDPTKLLAAKKEPGA